MTYREDELTSYLEAIDIPVLTATYRNRLDGSITVEEILRALKTLQSGRTPGPDGIAVELYKQYADVLAVRFHTMMVTLAEGETLPKSMEVVVIVVIPKAGKDRSLCSSYHPISLLNVYAKILAKISANRLTDTVITALVHPTKQDLCRAEAQISTLGDSSPTLLEQVRIARGGSGLSGRGEGL